MAEHKPSKARSAPKAAPVKHVAAPPRPAAAKAPSSPLQAAVDRLEANVSGLKRERDTLAADLAAANARIAALEAARTDAVNRIDWVLDSLQSVMLDKT